MDKAREAGQVQSKKVGQGEEDSALLDPRAFIQSYTHLPRD